MAKELKPHLDTGLSVTLDEAQFGFSIHDALEDVDEQLADEIDEAGLATNKDMVEIIRRGFNRILSDEADKDF